MLEHEVFVLKTSEKLAKALVLLALILGLRFEGCYLVFELVEAISQQEWR